MENVRKLFSKGKQLSPELVQIVEKAFQAVKRLHGWGSDESKKELCNLLGIDIVVEPQETAEEIDGEIEFVSYDEDVFYKRPGNLFDVLFENLPSLFISRFYENVEYILFPDQYVLILDRDGLHCWKGLNLVAQSILDGIKEQEELEKQRDEEEERYYSERLED